MHICHIITRLIIGGAQENTVLSCRGLVERGHRVTLIAGPETGPEGSLWDQAERSGAELVTVANLRRAVRPAAEWRARHELAAILRRLRPDVVHTHSSKAGILGRWAAIDAGIPTVVHTIHGMSFNRTQSWPVRLAYRWLERNAARGTDVLVTVADAMIEQAIAAKLAPRDRFVTIRSGMETDRFARHDDARQQYRNAWGVGPNDVVIGTVARLFENKGYEEILAAMPAAVRGEPRLRFVWVGDGAHRSGYERKLTEMGLHDRVTFTGLVPPDAVPAHLNGFDVVLHASRWEGLPRAIVQGLLTEIPAVSFDNDGAPEVVLPDLTGILVPLGDTTGLAGALTRLAADEPLRRKMGREGRRRCLAMFDWRMMVDALDALYTRLVDHGRLGL